METTTFEKLREDFYRAKEQDQKLIIDEITSTDNTSDTGRRLLQFYEECEWRTTRLYLLGKLAFYPHERVANFLIDLISRSENDLPLCEKAIHSLGAMKLPFTTAYLKKRYQTSQNEILKPIYLSALAHSQDPYLKFFFEKELTNLRKKESFSFQKTTLQLIGNFRMVSELPYLLKEVQTEKNESLKLTLLLSIGKLSKKASDLVFLKSLFSEDATLKEVVEMTLSQSTLRSELTLEDVLVKLFETSEFDSEVLLELSFYEEAEIKEGLTLFDDEKFRTRKNTVLSYLKKENPDEFDEASQDIALFLKKDLTEKADEVAILNTLSQLALCFESDSREKKQITDKILSFLGENKEEKTVNRAIRALGETKANDKKIYDVFKTHFENPVYQNSVLYALEQLAQSSLPSFFTEKLNECFKRSPLLTLRVLKSVKSLKSEEKKIDGFLTNVISQNLSREMKIEILNFLAAHPRPLFLVLVIAQLKEERILQLKALVTAKSYGDESIAEHLIPFLNLDDSILFSRALDLCLSLKGVKGKRLAMDFYRDHALDEMISEKIVRCFEPPTTGETYFRSVIEQILKDHPSHPFKDGLTGLRDRMSTTPSSASQKAAHALLSTEIKQVDESLKKDIKGFDEFDEGVKSALRSAEVPFVSPEFFDTNVDKASSVLEYCKALDLLLERRFGLKHLFPRLERELASFQNTLCRVGLGEDYPSHEHVLESLGLKSYASGDFPTHKMRTMAVSFLNGRILNDSLKVIDGLRAWSVLILIFCRKLPDETRIKPLFTLPGISDREIVQFCVKLNQLQDIRNPAAHRQTYLQMSSVADLRREVFASLNLIYSIF